MRVSVVGYFGFKSGKLDGQTVKTQAVYRLICEHYGSVGLFDTEEAHSRPWLVAKMLWVVAVSNVAVYLPAHNNFKYFFPLVWIVAKLFRTRILYPVVGGWLADFIEKLPIHRAMLRSISALLPETPALYNALAERYSLKNVELMPNFRFQAAATERHEVSERLRLVFMARVNRQKGLDMVFALGDFIVKKGYADRISVSFFGQVNPADKQYFFSNLQRFPFMSYGGTLSWRGFQSWPPIGNTPAMSSLMAKTAS